MMKRPIFFALLSISLAAMMTSCMVRGGTGIYSEGLGSGSYVNYSYWYYPSTQVYYDYQQRVYYYPENGGWFRSAALPSRFATSSTHVMVKVNSDKPYTDFDKHRANYPSQSGTNRIEGGRPGDGNNGVKMNPPDNGNHKTDMGQGTRDTVTGLGYKAGVKTNQKMPIVHKPAKDNKAAMDARIKTQVNRKKDGDKGKPGDKGGDVEKNQPYKTDKVDNSKNDDGQQPMKHKKKGDNQMDQGDGTDQSQGNGRNRKD